MPDPATPAVPTPVPVTLQTAVIVNRGTWAFQEACPSKDDARAALLRIKQLHPSAFRDAAGLSAAFVSLDERMQAVGTPAPIDVAPFVGANPAG